MALFLIERSLTELKMKGRLFPWSRKRKLTGAVVFVILICLTQYLAFQRFQILREHEVENVTEKKHAIEKNLTTLLNNSESATRTLAFIVGKYGKVDTFDSLAEIIISSNKYLDALQLTRNGVITEVYPLVGNESVLGLDVLQDSLVKNEALKALRIRKLFFAGPLQLRQGGFGIVGRLPIFTNGTFYGFAVVIIKFSTFLTAAGIDTSAQSAFRYQVSKIDPNTNEEVFFLPSLFSTTDGAHAFIDLPVGDWRILVQHKDSRRRYAEVIWISMAGLAISLASTFVIYYMLSQPEKLQLLVGEQTRRIETSERYFKALIDNIADAIVLLDRDGNMLYQSPSTKRITGYMPDELKLLDEKRLIHSDDREKKSRVFEQVVNEPGIMLPVTYRLLNKSGNYVWLEGMFSNLLSDEVIQAIVFNYRDISHLKEAQEKLEKAYKENQATLNRITFNVISLDSDWRYTFINDAALSTHPLGREGTIGKVIWDIHPELKNTFYNKFREARDKNVEVEFENYSELFNKWFQIKIYPSVDGLTLFYHDITNQKLVDAKIRDSEQRLLESQSVAKIGSWETDLVSLSVIWSRETYRIFELDPDNFQPTHTSFLDFVHRDDRARVDAAFKASHANGDITTVEHRIITGCGKLKWVEERWYVSKNAEGKLVRTFGTCQDITERKIAQDQILNSANEVRKLTVHLEKVREEERTRIAREIHDELGQQLTGLKMDVEWMAKKVLSNPVVLDKITEMISLIDQTVVTIRRIVSELRPGVLDDLGLIPALEWQCNEFEKRTGIKCETSINLDDYNFSKEFSINLFRIYQEALTNIAKHSKATSVRTMMEERNGHLIFSIKDNGVGLEKSKAGNGNSWGIVGMRERVVIFEGDLLIDSDPDSGTVVTIKIPIQNTLYEISHR